MLFKIIPFIFIGFIFSGCGPSKGHLKQIDSYLEMSKDVSCREIRKFIAEVQKDIQKKYKK